MRPVTHVVDGDEAVGEHHHCVGKVGSVHVRRAAVGLQLVAEVADEAAEQAGRQVGGRLDRVGGDFAVEQLEDRAALGAAAVGAVRLREAGVDVVFEHAALGPGAGAEVGALGEPGRRVGAVEPEGVLAVAEESFEQRLGRGLAGQRAAAHLHPAGQRAGHLRAALRRLPRPSRAAPRALALPRQRVEVLDQRRPVLGRDRLRVELDAPQRPPQVFDPHHHAVVGPRGDVAIRPHVGDLQRVVADHREVLRDPLEQAALLVADAAEPAVHRLRRAADLALEQVAEPLVAEADAEHRDLAVAEDVVADAEVVPALRRAGAGGEDDRVEVPAFQRPPGDGVVVDHDRLFAADAGQQVEDVVGVGVVVVDQQRPHRCPSSPSPRAQSSSAAPTTRSTCAPRSRSSCQRERCEA